MERTYGKGKISVAEAFKELNVGDVTHLPMRHYKVGTVRNRCSLMNSAFGKTYIDKLYVTETNLRKGYISIKKRGE